MSYLEYVVLPIAYYHPILILMTFVSAYLVLVYPLGKVHFEQYSNQQFQLQLHGVLMDYNVQETILGTKVSG